MRTPSSKEIPISKNRDTSSEARSDGSAEVRMTKEIRNMNDLKFAFRQLLKNPGFTVVAVLTLALGIGANTAIFSFVNAILLRPLPIPEPDRVVHVWESWRGEGTAPVAWPKFIEWKQQSQCFEAIAGCNWGESFVLATGEKPE